MKKFIVPAVVVALLVAAAFTFLGGEDRKTVTALFPRTIAICAADGRRLAAGEEPLVRMVRVGDRWVPWHESGSMGRLAEAGPGVAGGGHGAEVQKGMAQAYLNQGNGRHGGLAGR